MIIGTAGHIDHGKTALVKALTGIDADRLAEEKRRGITIELGFAYTDRLGFVDVPGHERFVHTMLAGAAGIDAALLVIALDDGVMPQTREHAAILDLLGIDRGIIVLTKLDLARDRVDDVSQHAHSLLAGTGLRDAPHVAVSAHTGEGIDTLAAMLKTLGPKPRDSTGHARLAVDRAFTLAGAGVVVTGTLVAGRIAVDDRLILSPKGLDVRVRGLHAHNQPAQAAEAGDRVALNITGPRISKDAVARGDWVLHPDIHAPVSRVDVRFRLLPDEAGPLRAGKPVHLHAAAAHGMARVSPLQGDRIDPGESALVRLTLDKPMGILAGDRIVVRDASATRTIGGGTVIDPFPPARGARTPTRLGQLAALENPDDVAALREVLAMVPGWIDRAIFARARNLTPAGQGDVFAAAPALIAGEMLMSPVARDALCDSVLQALASFHKESPDQPGQQAERLRLSLPLRPPLGAYRAVIELLLRQGRMQQEGPWLRLPEHRIQLTPQDERIWAKARPLIAAEPFRPPRTRDLAQALNVPEMVMRGTLKRLQRLGKVVEIAHDHFFLAETVEVMKGVVAHLAAESTDGLLAAAAFRDQMKSGRKVAIQILEYFDRTGFTARIGDARRLRT